MDQEDDRFVLNINPLNDTDNDDDYSVMSSAYNLNPIQEEPNRLPDRSINRSPNPSISKLKKASGMNVDDSVSDRKSHKKATREITQITN